MRTQSVRTSFSLRSHSDDSANPAFVLLESLHLESAHLLSEPSHPVAGTERHHRFSEFTAPVAENHPFLGQHYSAAVSPIDDILTEEEISKQFADFQEFLASDGVERTVEASEAVDSLISLASQPSPSFEVELRYHSILERFRNLRADPRYVSFLAYFSTPSLTESLFYERSRRDLIAGHGVLVTLESLPEQRLTTEQAVVYEDWIHYLNSLLQYL